MNQPLRASRVQRQTAETDVSLELVLDGTGQTDLNTGVPFLEHMLEQVARHGRFDLTVRAKGDIEIDDHHTVEDVAICLGRAFREALGDKRGIRRYGNAFVPMDEALAQAAVDISGRPHFEFRGEFPRSQVGTFDVELVHEFFWKLALEGRMTLHVILHYGRNTHHMIEACFKALGRALDEATALDPRIQGVPSSKGVLE
ncbi:imidazoleglycerol-phosphate dehydratase HisB [Staphylospora marina]|uniref:imidazoleglycerol-phosphate dehydratase HisB n=1 Tax=Staphylospora marina TaxID=2490858 RepID=UPI000F5B934D|nr:imidazoleglycerol-phosphate dehydratase HisB [Staphylospora marina]